MKKETAKLACIEVVDGLKCILEAQLGKRSKEGCIPVIMKPVHRFCDIARTTEKRFRKEDPHYEISRFLGASPDARRKMGLVCSFQRKFPECDDVERLHKESSVFSESIIPHTVRQETFFRALPRCAREVQDAIKVRPIEETEKFSTITESFETMRDWMHVSGYATPDYVWSVPQNMRRKTKELFEWLSSEKVTSEQDLEDKKKEIEQW